VQPRQLETVSALAWETLLEIRVHSALLLQQEAQKCDAGRATLSICLQQIFQVVLEVFGAHISRWVELKPLSVMVAPICQEYTHGYNRYIVVRASQLGHPSCPPLLQ
jgi:hypothetical protein